MTRILERTDGRSVALASRDWRGAVGGAYVDDAAGARARAARLLLDARREARAIILAAQDTVQELAAAELQQARQRGYAEGQAQAREELATMAAPLALLAAGAALDHAESMRRLDGEVLALAMAIASAVVKHEVAGAPDTILGVARAALDELSLGASVTMRVHPSDEQLLAASVPLLGLPPTLPVSVVGDVSVAPGGCMVESGTGRVDATLDTQLDKIGTLLHEQLYATTD